MSDGFIHEMRAGDTLVLLPSQQLGATEEPVMVTLMEKSGRKARVKVFAPPAVEVQIRKSQARIVDRGVTLRA